MCNAAGVYQIYDRIAKRCFSLSERSTVNLINGLYGRDYPLDSKVSFNWTEHTDDDLRRTLSDTIITIRTPISSQSYHVEIQMDEDETMVVRMFEYGFGHASKSGTDKNVLRFPEPLVMYLYNEKELPTELELLVDFGEQGRFRYHVPTVDYLGMTLEELNRRKLIVLIPFQLLRLRKEIEKKRTPENLEALKRLIKDDILGSIQANLEAGNITKNEERKLRRMTLQLYHHLYDRYEEMEESGVTQMAEEALILDIDIIEHEHRQELKQLEEKKNAELRKLKEEKDARLQEKDARIRELEAMLKNQK